LLTVGDFYRVTLDITQFKTDDQEDETSEKANEGGGEVKDPNNKKHKSSELERDESNVAKNSILLCSIAALQHNMSNQFLFSLLCCVVIIFCAKQSEAKFALLTVSMLNWCGNTSCYETGLVYQCVDLTREWTKFDHGIGTSSPCFEFTPPANQTNDKFGVHVFSNGAKAEGASGELVLPDIQQRLPITWLENNNFFSANDPLPYSSNDGDYCEMTVNFWAGPSGEGVDACVIKKN
jgi:hypothetical protein